MQIKEKLFSSFILTFRGKWESIKHVLKKLFFGLVPLKFLIPFKMQSLSVFLDITKVHDFR